MLAAWLFLRPMLLLGGSIPGLQLGSKLREHAKAAPECGHAFYVLSCSPLPRSAFICVAVVEAQRQKCSSKLFISVRFPIFLTFHIFPISRLCTCCIVHFFLAASFSAPPVIAFGGYRFFKHVPFLHHGIPYLMETAQEMRFKRDVVRRGSRKKKKKRK